MAENMDGLEASVMDQIKTSGIEASAMEIKDMAGNAPAEPMAEQMAGNVPAEPMANQMPFAGESVQSTPQASFQNNAQASFAESGAQSGQQTVTPGAAPGGEGAQTAQANLNEAPPKKKFSLREWVPGPHVPNQLTIARICMIPLFVVFILWVPKPAGNILSMIVFIVASLTDTLDGYIARRYNYVTTFGKFMDPLADKLLVCSALICLVDIGRIESWIVIIIIAREFIISGFRLVAVQKGVVIAANIWGKVKTVFQMLMVILMLGNFGGFLGVTAQILKWLALALTIISLATYLAQNRAVLQDET